MEHFDPQDMVEDFKTCWVFALYFAFDIAVHLSIAASMAPSPGACSWIFAGSMTQAYVELVDVYIQYVRSLNVLVYSLVA